MRLMAVIAARGMQVFAVVDHAGVATAVERTPRSAVLVIFGDAPAAARVVDAAPLAALDLPFRVLVWRDGPRTLVSYPATALSIQRLGLDAELAAVMSALDGLVAVVIDR